MFSLWRKWKNALQRSTIHSRATQQRAGVRPRLEGLEDRTLPSLDLFLSAVNVPVGVEPFDITAGDFDGDGREDIASMDAGNVPQGIGAYVTILRNTGGAFTPMAGSPIFIGEDARSLTAGDFNGDGMDDFAVANYAGAPGDVVRVFLATGGGQFLEAPGSPNPVGGRPRQIATGDLNGDGKLDLVTANQNGVNVSVLLGTGTGAFASAGNFPADLAGSAAVLTLLDYNVDGKLDVVTVGGPNGATNLLLGDGTGQLAVPIVLSGIPLAAGDFTGDGKQDLVIAHSQVCIYQGDGFGIYTPVAGACYSMGSGDLTAIDLNGDAKLDLVAYGGVANSVQAMIGNGDGTFTAADGSPFTVGMVPIALVVRDFNADGRLDVATANLSSNNVSVLINAGDPTCMHPPAGLVSWWPGEGNADDVVGGNHGTLLNGALANAQGKVGQAFSFDGVDDFVEIPDAANLTPRDALTLEAWVNPDVLADNDPSHYRVIMSKYDTSVTHQTSWVLSMIFGGRLRFAVYDGPGQAVRYVHTTSSVLTAGQWSHVAASFVGGDAQQFAIYVDGVLVPHNLISNQIIPTIFDSSSPVLIGAITNPRTNFWDGLIDEPSIYSRALSADEIRSIYQAGPAGKCKDAQPPPVDVALLSAELTNATTVEFTYGTTGTVGSFQVGLYRSADLTHDAGDELIKMITVTPSLTNPQTPESVTVIAPLKYDPEYRYLVVADPLDDLTEVSEFNNTAFMPFPGVTVITHGWQLGAGESDVIPGWALDMALGVIQRAGGNGSIFFHDRTFNDGRSWTATPRGIDWAFQNSNDPHDEIVLVYDWVWESDNNLDAPGGVWLEAAADNLFASLLNPAGVVRLEETAALIEKPLHLIGHSRGSLLNSEVVRRLAHEFPDVKVDHVTFLDPHRAEGYGDPQPLVYRNVSWADNFWRQDADPADFDGQPVQGAWNLELSESALGGIPFVNDPGHLLEHSDTHLWYRATIDPATGSLFLNGNDDFQTSVGQSHGWWEAGRGYSSEIEPASDREFVGYAYSRLGGKARPDRPEWNLVPESVPTVFNGDFESRRLLGSTIEIPGWERHGGGGLGIIESAAGNGYLKLDAAHSSRTHNPLYIPEDAESLKFVFSMSTPVNGLLYVDLGGYEASVPPANFQGAESGFVGFTLPIPDHLRGTIRTLTFSLASHPTMPTVRIDHVRFAHDPTPGVTVLVHGFNPPGDGIFDGKNPIDYWGEDNVLALLERFGGGRVYRYQPENGEFVWDRRGQFQQWDDPNGQVILVHDWLRASNDAESGQAEAAAEAFFAALATGLPGDLSQNKMIDLAQPTESRPLHFIGHSRGTAVVSEIVQRLGVYDVAVDYVTYLDPHDFDESAIPYDGFYHDPAVQVWSNVSFADNFYQIASLSLAPLPPLPYVPSGRPLDHLQPPNDYYYNYNLSGLPGLGDGHISGPHGGVVDWYFGTIAPGSERPEWYTDGLGANTGFSRWLGLGGYAKTSQESGIVNPADPLRPTLDHGLIPFPANDTEDDNGESTTFFMGDFELKHLDDGNSLNNIPDLVFVHPVNGVVPFPYLDNNSIAGWSYHGGSGSGQVAEHNGNHYLSLQKTALAEIRIDARTRTHNRFYLPADQQYLVFDVQIQSPKPDTTLNVFFDDHAATPLAMISAATPFAGFFGVEILIPEHLRGMGHTLTFEVTDGGFNNTPHVNIDNIRFEKDRAIPVAQIVGPSTGVRGQPRTFALSAAEPQPEDHAGGFTYVIDWGDGTPSETIQGGDVLSREHLFAESGAYVIHGTARNNKGEVSSFTTHSIAIVAAELQGTTLAVGGTIANDVIQFLKRGNKGILELAMNGDTYPPFSNVSRIIAFGQAGDDDIRVQPNITLSVELYGGEGNDTLYGSNGPNILVGGAGNDSLRGGKDGDLLIGGSGADTLKGLDGDDILLAADFMAGESFSDIQSALRYIMEQWSAPSSYSTRINVLYDYVWSRVTDDDSVDTLFGGEGLDWFFANLTGGTRDLIRDLLTGIESAVDLNDR